MFNKLMKRGQKKPPKPEAIETPMPSSSSSSAPDVTVNHASRFTGAPPHPQNVSSIQQNPGIVEVLPMLKDVSISDKHGVFVRKVQVCCIFFDFSDPMKSVREKEIKRQNLTELVDLVQTGSCKMNEIMQEEMVKMISVNIFRPFPPNNSLEAGDPEEDEMFMDPTWPHLQLVYELLLRYVVSSDTDTKVAKKYLDHTFVMKMLDLFDTEDLREREYLKTIMHRLYGRFMIHRPFIRSEINNVFYRFVFETERYNGIGELLEILATVINGFALPMKEEHKLFLTRALIPLHKPKNVASYHQQLAYCVVQFVEKDYRLADTVIKGVLKYWPVTNCGKQVLFLGELEEILEATQQAEFQRCIVPLFRQIGRSLKSQHFQVAERALFMWNNEHIVGLIADNRHEVLPIIFDALEKNIRSHWNQAINGLSSNVRRMFLEMDADLFEDCEREYEEKEARASKLEERRVSKWRRLEEVASQVTVG